MFRTYAASRRTRGFCLALSLLTSLATSTGCGGDDGTSTTGPAAPVRKAASENQPPRIDGLLLKPENPTSADALTLVIQANDPDRDRLDTFVDWYRNGSLYEEEGELAREPGEFERDDEVWAEVTVSDGIVDVTESTEPIVIGNAIPEIRAIRITPDEATTTDLLTARVEGGDPDGDPVQYEYRWQINGTAVAGEATGRLAPGTAKRKDRVVVEARIGDGEDWSSWVSSPEFVMYNAPPQITTQPNYELSGSGVYRYDVRGKDPDGDRPLKYELVEGPPGMSVDITSGVVTWTVPSTARGTYPVELSVSDPWGARTLQRYSLDVAWDEQPASPAPSSSRRSSSDDSSEEDDF